MEVPEEKTTEVESGDCESLHDVKEFIDNKLYSTLIDRIKREVKNEIKNALNSNQLNADIRNDIVNDNNDSLITSLKSEIDFLRNELLSKDKIIEMIIKDKPTSMQFKNLTIKVF